MSSLFSKDNKDGRQPMFRAALIKARQELHTIINPPLGLHPATEDYAEIQDIITHLEQLLGYE